MCSTVVSNHDAYPWNFPDIKVVRGHKVACPLGHKFRPCNLFFLTWPMAKVFQLFGITYLVGKISRSNFFFSGSIGWVSFSTSSGLMGLLVYCFKITFGWYPLCYFFFSHQLMCIWNKMRLWIFRQYLSIWGRRKNGQHIYLEPQTTICKWLEINWMMNQIFI